MDRRGFLKLLGLGATAAALPSVLVPERRIWQVPSNAPVGSRIARVGTSELSFGEPIWLDLGHGHTYDPPAVNFYTPQGIVQIRAYSDQSLWAQIRAYSDQSLWAQIRAYSDQSLWARGRPTYIITAVDPQERTITLSAEDT